ncbi:unnamed protein product [Dovyalis caffra]|uniref:Uncharacterized protein n=1 Tax=Dovyalis caffra TaxID=77055 RepID=A0AAV1SGN7_9ROSI|nr:unnamed protein product [Dovyalis caffra]
MEKTPKLEDEAPKPSPSPMLHSQLREKGFIQNYHSHRGTESRSNCNRPLIQRGSKQTSRD